MRRVILPALLGLALYYALFGGEYSVFELRRARIEREREAVALAERRRQIDSLRAWADSLNVDSVTLERIARERFGMIREGEILYRYAQPPDSAEETDTIGSAR